MGSFLRKKRGLGVALDIGTTALKGLLVRLPSGKVLAEEDVPNEQKAFGRDVITRLQSASDEAGLARLNRSTVSAVNKLLLKLVSASGRDAGEVKNVVAVGNSAMHHIVLSIDPKELARAPFKAVTTATERRNAALLGLRTSEDAEFLFLPNIGGFVGSDALANILSSGVHRRKRPSVIADIGTNGEIVLASRQGIFAASCAAGPVFEGGHISCGMPAAADGAVKGVSLENGRLRLETVGGSEPKGLTGSGLLDLAAVLLRQGKVSSRGNLAGGSFVFYDGPKRRLAITQDDIRQLQLAKAAFVAGVRILFKKSGAGFAAISGFYVTGVFGGSIKLSAARAVGLIPKAVAAGKTKYLSKGALYGAKKVLVDPSGCAGEIKYILSRCVHVELHRDPSFQDIYAEEIAF